MSRFPLNLSAKLALPVAGMVAFTAIILSGCKPKKYASLLRPAVLKQLDPEVVNLVNELPAVDKQNEEIIGRLFAHGGLGKAKQDNDGVYRAKIRVPPGQFIWKPAIIAMRHSGELELEFSNDDPFSHHAALLPSNGGRVLLTLQSHETGKTRIRLDGPGYYWFGCPVANHAGRGMLGLVLVGGETPAAAKLDRPKQQRP